MEEQRERNSCCICGEDMAREDRQNVMCEACEDNWRREVDANW